MSRQGQPRKVEMPVAKSGWHPSPLVGQIVIVSSRSSRGEVHAAAKSWVSMVASDPPTLSLACRLSHRTAINILETREFVVNIPGEDLAGRALAAGESVAAALEADAPAWTFAPSTRVNAPLVQECRAHLECVLDASRRFSEEEIVLYGRIVAVSADEAILEGEPEARYRALRPLLYLEEGLFGVLDGVRRHET